jgi:hypothetical protein
MSADGDVGRIPRQPEPDFVVGKLICNDAELGDEG